MPWIYLKKGFAEAAKADARVIIIRLNTYGGEVVYADSMRTRILNSKIPVIAFIDNNAASAGALIAIACKKIYMAFFKRPHRPRQSGRNNEGMEISSHTPIGHCDHQTLRYRTIP